MKIAFVMNSNYNNLANLYDLLFAEFKRSDVLVLGYKRNNEAEDFLEDCCKFYGIDVMRIPKPQHYADYVIEV